MSIIYINLVCFILYVDKLSMKSWTHLIRNYILFITGSGYIQVRRVKLLKLNSTDLQSDT